MWWFYCNPMALCFTTRLSMLKNSLYRSFIAGGGTKLFSNPISFDSSCMSLPARGGADMQGFYSSTASPFVFWFHSSRPLTLGMVVLLLRPAPNNEHVLRPAANTTGCVYSKHSCVYLRPWRLLHGQTDRKTVVTYFLFHIYFFVLLEIFSAPVSPNKEVMSVLALSLLGLFAIKQNWRFLLRTSASPWECVLAVLLFPPLIERIGIKAFFMSVKPDVQGCSEYLSDGLTLSFFFFVFL